MLAIVLLGAFLVSRGCANRGTTYDAKKAIAIARKQLDFTPKCSQIRYLRTGLSSQPVWAVSLWTLDKRGQFDRVTVVVVAARTGRVISVNKQPALQSTPPQCSSPV